RVEGVIIKRSQPTTTCLTSNVVAKLAANIHIYEAAISYGDLADNDEQGEGRGSTTNERCEVHSRKLFYPATQLKLEELVGRL
ncbi:unnamed protein product, partial [Rotaria sp. Silwood2]